MSVKRLLDCAPSELARYTKAELLDAIAGSEGRVLDVTNAEYAASLSADILLLNMFDVQHPVINALPKVPEVETVRELKRLTGRVVGINLEPCDLQAAKSNDGTLWKMSGGRLATVENARRAAEMGVDLIVLTGNPRRRRGLHGSRCGYYSAAGTRHGTGHHTGVRAQAD